MLEFEQNEEDMTRNLLYVLALSTTMNLHLQLVLECRFRWPPLEYPHSDQN